MQYELALKNYKQSLNIKIETGDIIGSGICLANIGSIYASKKEYDEALKYYFDALDIHTKISHKRYQAISLCSIGEIYIKIEKYKEAKEYLEIGEKILESIGDLNYIGAVYNNLSSAWDYLENQDKTIEYLNKALKNAKKMKHPLGIGIILCNIGSFLKKIGRVTEAIPYFLESRTILNSIQAHEVQAPIMCLLDLAHTTEEKNWGEFKELLMTIKKMNP